MSKEPPTNKEILAGLTKQFPKMNCLEALDKKMAARNPNGGYTLSALVAKAVPGDAKKMRSHKEL